MWYTEGVGHCICCRYCAGQSHEEPHSWGVLKENIIISSFPLLVSFASQIVLGHPYPIYVSPPVWSFPMNPNNAPQNQISQHTRQQWLLSFLCGGDQGWQMHFKSDANSEGLREAIELLVPKGSEASSELGRKGHCDQLVPSVMGQVSTKRLVYHHSLLILPFEKMIPGCLQWHTSLSMSLIYRFTGSVSHLP